MRAEKWIYQAERTPAERAQAITASGTVEGGTQQQVKAGQGGVVGEVEEGGFVVGGSLFLSLSNPLFSWAFSSARHSEIGIYKQN